MYRRAYLGAVAGVTVSTALAGCLQGDAVVHETRISATSPTKEWEVELEEGNEMRLEVNHQDGTGRIRGSVTRAGTGDQIATTTADDSHERFVVPATGTYIVSVDPRGATGEIILRDMNE